VAGGFAEALLLSVVETCRQQNTNVMKTSFGQWKPTSNINPHPHSSPGSERIRHEDAVKHVGITCLAAEMLTII